MKITIAIPTIAGRGKYLESCLKTCVSQDDDFEILVSDNSQGDAQELVCAFNDRRIRYIRPPNFLPMAIHWSFVVNNIESEYACFIGDDDGLMPNCISRVKALIKTYSDVPIMQALSCFHWDDYPTPSKQRTTSFFYDVDGAVHEYCSRAFLDSVASCAKSYTDGPMVYHGFVPTRLLQSAAVEGFFRSASPDVYSAMAIAAQANRYVRVGEVLTLPGQGAKGNGSAHVRGDAIANQFAIDLQTRFHSRFNVRAIQMQIFDALLEAAQQYAISDIDSKLRYDLSLALSINAARNISSSRLRIAEWLGLLKIARKKQAVTALFVYGIADQWKRRRERLARRDIRGIGKILAGESYDLGVDVGEIYEATLMLDRYVSNRCSGVRQPQDIIAETSSGS